MTGHWKEGGTSWRTSPRPIGWKAIRQAVLERDGGQCVAINRQMGWRCTNPATDVDHINDPDDHSLENLRSLCSWHHRQRTAHQASAAASAKRQSAKPQPRKHPGLIDT